MAVDQQRIKNGSEPLFMVSRRSKKFLRRAMARIDKMRFKEGHPEDIQVALNSLREVAAELDASEKMSEAASNQESLL